MSKTVLIGGLALVITVVIAACATGPGNTLVPTGTTPAAGTSNPAVTPGEVATAGPSTSSSYGVGDRVKLGDEEYITLEKAEVGFTSDFAKPAAGNVNVSFLLAFEGINPSGASYNPFYFNVKDESGFQYNFSAFGKEPQLASSNDLQPGKIARGWMTFEVPKAAKTLTLAYAPGFGGETVEFAYTP
jgi:hypothetical protein